MSELDDANRYQQLGEQLLDAGAAPQHRLRQHVAQLPSGLWAGYLWVQWRYVEDDGTERWLPEQMSDGARPDVITGREGRTRRQLADLYRRDRRR